MSGMIPESIYRLFWVKRWKVLYSPRDTVCDAPRRSRHHGIGRGRRPVAAAPAPGAVRAGAPPRGRRAEPAALGAVLAPGAFVRAVRLARAGPHRRTGSTLRGPVP